MDPASGELLELCQTGGEQCRVAAELVDDEARAERLVGGLEQRDRAMHRGEDSPAVDVTDHHPGHGAVPRGAPVASSAPPPAARRRPTPPPGTPAVEAPTGVVDSGGA